MRAMYVGRLGTDAANILSLLQWRKFCLYIRSYSPPPENSIAKRLRFHIPHLYPFLASSFSEFNTLVLPSDSNMWVRLVRGFSPAENICCPGLLPPFLPFLNIMPVMYNISFCIGEFCGCKGSPRIVILITQTWYNCRFGRLMLCLDYFFASCISPTKLKIFPWRKWSLYHLEARQKVTREQHTDAQPPFLLSVHHTSCW